jgi:hypothetical protein
VGFLDKAKKLAGQVKDKAEEALAEAKSRTGDKDKDDAGAPAAGAPVGEAPAKDGESKLGTAYVPGMLGRPGWREKGLEDPAAVLPIADRDKAGVPRSTKSEIVEVAYGMGRRWTTGDKSTGLFYRLYPEHREWSPPGGTSPLAGVSGASQATVGGGKALVFFEDGDHPVVLETSGLDDDARLALAQAVAAHIKG